MPETLHIGIVGLGTVGVGTYKILTQNKELLSVRCGKKLEISAVSSRDASKDRGIDLSGVRWFKDPLEMATSPEIDIVVELIGGEDGIAYDLCKAALQNGKHFVTANKALIAKHGLELAKLAEGNSVALMFEAAVAGGIPILKSLREGLAANNYHRISGIINGTCNYILSAMKQDKRSFEDVLKEAQELGYAETPPDLDIDGIDTAHKLAIMSSIAYGIQVSFEDVHVEGIRNVSLDDVQYAHELGYVIKLLGIANKLGDKIEQRVHPCLVEKHVPIACIDGALNAIYVECDALGEALFTGAGAGEGPTASSVVADILDIASGRDSPAFGRKVDALEKGEFVDINHHEGEYYVRFNVQDKPGVLASITSALSAENIGFERVLQNAHEASNTAQIALTTHKISEAAIQKALQNIAQMDYVIESPHLIRIEDF